MVDIDIDIVEIGFHHDGDTAHFSQNMRNYLDLTFLNRSIAVLSYISVRQNYFE